MIGRLLARMLLRRARLRHFLGNRDGSALLLVLGLLLTMGVMIAGTMVIARHAERLFYARGLVSDTETLATSAVDVLTERLIARAGQQLGTLTSADITALNTEAATVPSTLTSPRAGLSALADSIGFRVVDVRDFETIPHDERVLAAWTHQPRRSYLDIPSVGGLTAARTVEIEIFATAYGNRGSVRMATRRVAVSVVAPHQWAIYAAGDATFFSYSSEATVGGPVRVDGAAAFPTSTSFLRYVGGIEARDGIGVQSPSTHIVAGTTFGSAGMPMLASMTRGGFEADPQANLAQTQGRVRIRPGVAGEMVPTRFQTTNLAGSGECPDFTGHCGGAGYYLPSVTVQRRTPGPSTGYAVDCGEPYATACGAAATAIGAGLSYRPYPFASAPPAGQAAFDPTSPTVLWQGLFPDPRREAPCTATVGANTFQTLRCPTNAHGFDLNMAALPAGPGGFLSVRRAINQVTGANPNGASEVLVIRNAATLAGPLTIHSEIPVFIVGNYNTNTPKPSMITAPRIVVLPNETAGQLQEASRWDFVAPFGGGAANPLPLQARSPTTIYAVLRSGYCGFVGAVNYGGTWEGLPAILGDWSRASLRINGAIEGFDETPGGNAGCGRWAAPISATPPGGLATTPPASRSVLFNRQLLHPAFQPPGSYTAANIPATGLAGAASRNQARQAWAFGGTGVLRLVQDLRTIPPTAAGSSLRPTGPTPTIGTIANVNPPPAL